VSSVPAPVACPLPEPTRWGRLVAKLNAEWHKPALQFFTFIVLAHWAEHLVQAIQVYVLGWPLKDARGLLGMPIPWLVKSEALHYGYAFVMLVGLWLFRKGFVGRSYVWWMIAFGIQFWHHIEHALLQGQVIYGHNLLGAPAPVSCIQMLGFLEGSASTGFNGLLVGPPAHDMSLLTWFVRRLEVHLFYNTVVFVPMAIAMYYHLFPSPGEEAHMGCACAWHKSQGPVCAVPAAK
jgi:hypothetical protein